MSRYQGLVALDGGSLEDAAHEYFLRSEQIPTRVRLAVGEEWRASDGGKHRWRAGGMLMQFLPKAPERARQADLHPGDAPEGVEVHAVAEDDAWVEARSLIETVEDVELIDPELSGERLLYRLFHERGVRVFNPLALKAQCSCSRDAVWRDAEELLAGRSRRDGQGRQGRRDLRVLLVGVRVHAGRGRRGRRVGSRILRRREHAMIAVTVESGCRRAAMIQHRSRHVAMAGTPLSAFAHPTDRRP